MKMKAPALFKNTVLIAAAMRTCAALAGSEPPWPPATNGTPTVTIVTPQEGAAFLVGADIHICAAASYFTDMVANVEFFAGTNSLGVVSNGFGGFEEDWRPPVFCLTWPNPGQGDYTLTAVATDVNGNSISSSGVDIMVVTDTPPKVRILRPQDGAMILGPTNVDICAWAYDQDGSTVSVEFFAGTNSLGVVSSPTNSWGWGDQGDQGDQNDQGDGDGMFPFRAPYCITWANAPVGEATLTAVATDNVGLMTTSAPVTINIVTDLPPKVRIVHPGPRSECHSSGNVTICAKAKDPDGTVSQVEFFEGTNSLGVVTNTTQETKWEGDWSFYCLTWTNPPAGNYIVTAVATDNGGLSTTSAPVNISVVPPPPPVVKITNPHDGATIHRAPVNVHVCALERHFTNSVVNVQFFASGTSIGTSTNAPFSIIIWDQAQPGSYSLTAVATDSSGATFTSPPISVNVVTNGARHHHQGGD